jgi:hypothetical protein
VLHLAGDQLFGPVHFVIAVEALKPESPGQFSVFLLLEKRAVRKCLVVEDGADLVDAVGGLDLLVSVIRVIEIVLKPAQQPARPAAEAAVKTVLIVPHPNVDLLVHLGEHAAVRAFDRAAFLE